MANTGNKQAIIAYKVSPNGEPVDVDGVLTSISGKRQAIALLNGQKNPNPTLYEVELNFNAKGLIKGEPSVTVDLEYCPVHYIKASKERIVLTPENNSDEIILYSSADWVLSSSGNNAIISPILGGKDSTVISFTKNNNVGDNYYIFTNTASGQYVKIRVININSKDWILKTGKWDNLGFWFNGSIWNY